LPERPRRETVAPETFRNVRWGQALFVGNCSQPFSHGPNGVKKQARIADPHSTQTPRVLMRLRKSITPRGPVPRGFQTCQLHARTKPPAAEPFKVACVWHVPRPQGSPLDLGPSTVWNYAEGAARKHHAPKSTGDCCGLGTNQQKWRCWTRPRDSVLPDW
jgi:hypothetical protein